MHTEMTLEKNAPTAIGQHEERGKQRQVAEKIQQASVEHRQTGTGEHGQRPEQGKQKIHTQLKKKMIKGAIQIQTIPPVEDKQLKKKTPIPRPDTSRLQVPVQTKSAKR